MLHIGPIKNTVLTPFLLIALVLSCLQRHPTIAYSTVANEWDENAVSISSAALIPLLKCPTGICKIGGFRFDVDWNCPKCSKCPANGKWKRHTGVDLSANPGDAVVVAERGFVKAIYDAGNGWGKAILVEHGNGNSKYVTQYMHVNPTFNLTDEVKQHEFKRGETIATIASISDPHLHFGVWAGPYSQDTKGLQRGALPQCSLPVTSCDDGRHKDGCFPQSWVDPMPYLSTSAGVIVVSTSLRIMQGNAVAPGSAFGMGKPMQGTFTVANLGTSPVVMKKLLIAGRLGTDTCPNGICPDFLPFLPNVTLGPNETRRFSGTFTPPRPGTYNFDVVYQKADGNWQWPVDSYNGSRNHLTIIVRPGPTLSSADPPSLIASPNKQRVVLYGTGLAKTIYCRMTLPNGKTTNLYIPLRQVINGSPDRIELSTEFRTRGRYYIRAHTLMEHSNELAIEVR